MFYGFLARYLPAWLAGAACVVVYSLLLILMVLLANPESAVFRYMK